MSLKTRHYRSKFVDHYEEAMREILALGITPAQLEKLTGYGLLAKDTVTGYYEARSGNGRVATLWRAIQHVKRTGERAFYVEMDLQNLGGLNAALGHTGANEIYSAVAAIARSELTAVTSEATFFRHGGDETSAFLINTSEACVWSAMDVIRQEVARLARERNLHEIPHSKGGLAGRLRGIGLHFGVCEVAAHHEVNPTLVFRTADRALERVKAGRQIGPARRCPTGAN